MTLIYRFFFTNIITFNTTLKKSSGLDLTQGCPNTVTESLRNHRTPQSSSLPIYQFTNLPILLVRYTTRPFGSPGLILACPVGCVLASISTLAGGGVGSCAVAFCARSRTPGLRLCRACVRSLCVSPSSRSAPPSVSVFEQLKLPMVQYGGIIILYHLYTSRHVGNVLSLYLCSFFPPACAAVRAHGRVRPTCTWTSRWFAHLV